MKPFEYLAPRSISEACAMLSEHTEEAKLLAGGQSLLFLLEQRLITLRHVIDIKKLTQLDYIKRGQNSLKIGALTTQRTLELSPLVQEKFPILRQMERVAAPIQVRNWGTIGGSLCHAEPSGDLGVALIALGAKVRAVSDRGEREELLENFFVDYLETILKPDEILTEVEVPTLLPHTGSTYIKESRMFGGFAIVSVAVIVTLNRDTISDARIVLGGVGPTYVRTRQAEEYLKGKRTKGKFEEVGTLAANEVHPSSDMEGSAEYKCHIARIIVNEAVVRSIKQATFM
ncbi:MAG: carbon monoxide dehydrogenase [Dehalococcoidales bacterium]|jgi:CO/xanthine dehydrogenase FAD-binding subunit|nr:carbon monoxide dehydrogenase [Dehalococcoidales bacterium]|tara:strand:- start:399 stop:1259 length:861 start_codon:yes stop_codon:yes gene_type:complete